MRTAFWTVSIVALLAASCAKDPDSTGGGGDAECSKQTDCANDQSQSCAGGTCVEVGDIPSMELRLSKGKNLNNKNIQSLRLVSVQTLSPNGKTVHCPTLGGQEVTSIAATKDPALFNVVFEKSFPLASGDVYQTAAPMNDDTGVVYGEVFDVPGSEQNDPEIKPLGSGCWDRSRAEDKIFDCNGHPCITFVLN